jgi:hypothetical protein
LILKAYHRAVADEFVPLAFAGWPINVTRGMAALVTA